MIPLQVDVTDKDELAAATAQIVADAGFVHLLVVNAGIPRPDLLGLDAANSSPGQLQDYVLRAWSNQDFLRPFATNVTGSYFTCAAFLGLLDKGNSNENRLPGVTSQVIVNSSISAYQKKYAGNRRYCLRNQQGSGEPNVQPFKHVFCALSNPAEMTAPLFADDKSGLGTGRLPAKRYGDEADLARAVLYLASRAGAYVNGLSLVVDGRLVRILLSTY
ncbi:hypothetical protein PpBr36_02224 [Pyricularia pennisetigena]|uniref:hypothetical protein n=1 Tax=Pyricularia pennisetigena TaxID=1578925 RepID=UPI001150136A|nr:hypothetical protein PpBr36_02224 [Pyricularia pennisetigena]TLS31500.1 hypothetical protein PpBr36_02224 [Pyricularia pennisetigena]